MIFREYILEFFRNAILLSAFGKSLLLGAIILPPPSFEGCLLESPFINDNPPIKIERWDYLNQSYDDFWKRCDLPSNEQVPKILHQIWLGSPFPKAFEEMRESFLRLHPDWSYILWTEQEIESLELENRFFYDQSTNFGEKSDIARYEILYQFGGVYIDIDFLALQALDIFCQKSTFFAGISSNPFGIPFINNAIIGAYPKHPILKHCIKLITRIRSPSEPVTRIIGTTGPKIFTRAIFESYPFEKPVVILPTTFFYPFPSNQRDDYKQALNWVKPESYAIHYWNMSWSDKHVHQR